MPVFFDTLKVFNGPDMSDPVNASALSRDRNRHQTLGFHAEGFSGVVHVEGSVSNPNDPTEPQIWFDIAEIEVYDENGSWFYEIEGEFALIRVSIRNGNYWTGVLGSTTNPVVSATGTSQVAGVPLSLNAGDTITDAANAVNALGISVKARVIDDALFLYRDDGINFSIVDITATPMGDLGIQPLTYSSGKLTVQIMR